MVECHLSFLVCGGAYRLYHHQHHPIFNDDSSLDCSSHLELVTSDIVLLFHKKRKRKGDRQRAIDLLAAHFGCPD